MGTAKLNIAYNLEYYKRKCDYYMTISIKALEKNSELQNIMIRILDENIDLSSKINELEEQKNEHRAYTVKLQISK